MEMKIDINLSAQEENKFRTVYLVLGILGVVYIILSLLFPDLAIGNNYYIWILFLPGIVEAILYGLGRNRMLGDNFPYLRIGEERIEKNIGGLFAKPEVYYWTDIKAIEVKLFEILLTTGDSNHKTIDLTNLTDDNLKIVKDYVSTIKKNRGL